jgi:hypothetical protein
VPFSLRTKVKNFARASLLRNRTHCVREIFISVGVCAPGPLAANRPRRITITMIIMAHLITLCALGGSGGGGRARGPFHPTSAIEPRGDLSHCLCDVASGDKFFFWIAPVLLRQRVLPFVLSRFRRVPRVLFHITLRVGGFLNQYPSANTRTHGGASCHVLSGGAHRKTILSVLSLSLGVCQTFEGERGRGVLHISSAVVN